MVTNVTSLLKTVKAVEDEATRGTRALEATIEYIKQELTVRAHHSAGSCSAAGTKPLRSADTDGVRDLSLLFATKTGELFVLFFFLLLSGHILSFLLPSRVLEVSGCSYQFVSRRCRQRAKGREVQEFILFQ